MVFFISHPFTLLGTEWPKGTSVLCPFGPQKHHHARTANTNNNRTAALSATLVQNKLSTVAVKDPTNLALGLLYLSAMHNNAEAQTILSYRWWFSHLLCLHVLSMVILRYEKWMMRTINFVIICNSIFTFLHNYSGTSTVSRSQQMWRPLRSTRCSPRR